MTMKIKHYSAPECISELLLGGKVICSSIETSVDITLTDQDYSGKDDWTIE